MTFRMTVVRMISTAALCALGVACNPPGGTDEQKDPHYLRGQELAQRMDYKGAIEAFEKALENSPRSASAHFELGILYFDEKKGNDPAAAIYHYERFLRLRPNSPHADVLKRQIHDCKTELARGENLVGGTAATQRDIDRMKTDIERLTAENAQLRIRCEQTGQTPPPTTVASAPKAATPARNETPATGVASAAVESKSRPAPVASNGGARTHTVKSGDISTSIAKQYNVKNDALIAANPGVDWRRLKIGQTVNIPAQ
ncbi:MAG: tetratricopeptide repeat protein [Verrucomicrobia bacterium]|nr:tetratricopeptide repeat protein [Verrucomicrobiota bacterium]